jgi:hypothetical protein
MDAAGEMGRDLMSGPETSSVRRREPLLYGVIGGLVVLVLALAVAVVMALGVPGQVPVAASSSPTIGPSATSAASAQPSLSPDPDETTMATLEPTTEPTAAPTTAPTAKPTPRPSPKPTPVPTVLGPTISSFTANPDYITSCDPIGGTTVTLTWTTSRASEVRIAIDPQGDDPLNHIYEQGLPPDGSAASIPYSCQPPNEQNGAKYHEYVLIAIEGGAHVTRSMKLFMLQIPT